jgi:hypothetical protein
MSQSDQALSEPLDRNRESELSTRQVSLWLTHADAQFLREMARERNQSLSGVIRSAIATWRRQRGLVAGGTKLVP